MADKRPSDINPDSGGRLSFVEKDALPESAWEAYDRLAELKGPGNLAGLRGPGGIYLNSPETSRHVSGLNHYLRFGSGMDPQVREIAILASARETDSEFEWTAHEPQALEEGVSRETIDVIKHRKPLDSVPGLDATHAAVIQLGREVVGGN